MNDIKYILKRILIGVGIFLLLGFFASCEVHAKTANLVIDYKETQIEIIPYLDFASLNGRIPTFNTTNYNPDYGYYVTNDTITQSGSGELACFSTGIAYKSGFTYALTLYIGANNSSIFRPNINDSNITGANSGSQAATNWQAKYYNITTNYSNYIPYQIDFSYAEGNINTYYGNLLLYIFTPIEDVTFICVPFNTANQNNTGYTIIYGFKQTSLGNTSTLSTNDIQNVISNSGLATANSVSQVQSSVNALRTEVQGMTQEQQETNNILTNDNVDGASSEVDGLLNNNAFNDSSGIQSIINAPLNFINGLTNSCSPITLTIPFINSEVTLPCIKEELEDHVPLIVPILSTAINGFVIYRILLDIVHLIKSSRDPEDDRIEVLDL